MQHATLSRPRMLMIHDDISPSSRSGGHLHLPCGRIIMHLPSHKKRYIERLRVTCSEAITAKQNTRLLTPAPAAQVEVSGGPNRSHCVQLQLDVSAELAQYVQMALRRRPMWSQASPFQVRRQWHRTSGHVASAGPSVRKATHWFLSPDNHMNCLSKNSRCYTTTQPRHSTDVQNGQRMSHTPTEQARQNPAPISFQ